MPEEKIGEDVLGTEPPKPGKYDKRKQELLEKAKEEVKKRKKAEEDEEIIRLSKFPIPGENPGELSPEERAEIIQRARLTGLSLQEEHYRSKPKRSKPKKEEKKESFFDFP
jgi:hypothetical protein